MQYTLTLYRRVAGALRPHGVPRAQGEQALVHRPQRLLQQRPVDAAMTAAAVV